MLRLLLTVLVSLFVATGAASAIERVLLQSTTSTQNSGLYDYLLPKFTAETGIPVDVVAVGTGQALRNARNGDADLLIVHSKSDEEAFVAEGYGLARYDLMYNDFIVIGPNEDPAGLANATTVAEALAMIHAAKATFISRGDDSGTHKKERRLWAAAGLEPSGKWYREIGSGMGATIRMAVEVQGYTISDRATWLAFNDKRDAKIVFEGDPPLFNQYGVIVVNPERHPHVRLDAATSLQDWLLGSRGQSLIASYRREGKQLFFPNAKTD